MGEGKSDDIDNFEREMGQLCITLPSSSPSPKNANLGNSFSAPLAGPTFKVVMVGDGGSGKSTWLRKLLKDEFEKEYHPTLGMFNSM